MKWFRLYSEARNDAKLRALSDAQHRVWFNLLCYASEMEERGCIKAVNRELLAVECCGADIDLLNETLEKLVRLRIVTASEEHVCFVNFMKRQYDKPSDTPERVSARVNRHRAKPETPASESETPSNADVTPEKRAYSDTETETENTQKELPPSHKNEKPPHGGHTSKPKPVYENPPSLQDVEAFCLKQGWPELAGLALDFQQQRGWQMKSGPVTDWQAAIRTWKSNRDEFARADGRRPGPARASPTRPTAPPGMTASAFSKQQEMKRLQELGMVEG